MKETSRFLPFLPDFFSFFPIFPDFFPILGNLFAVRGGALPPPVPPSGYATGEEPITAGRLLKRDCRISILLGSSATLFAAVILK